MTQMTATSPPDPDERPLQMANDRLAMGALVIGMWLTLGGLLWLALRTEETDLRALHLAATIVSTAGITAHAVIALQSWRTIGPFRWPLTAVLVIFCAWLSHIVLVRMGMAQSLIQDIVNMTMISGIALAVSQAWSGHRARRSLVAERARSARAEASLARGRLRPTNLLPVKVGHTEKMVDPATISRIQAEGNFTILYDRAGPIFVSEPMKVIIERLQPYGFVRVHKSYAVNADAVRERRRDSIILEDGVIVTVGRAYRI